MNFQRLKYFITFFLIFVSCSELLVNDSETDQNLADFDYAWQIAQTYYPFFEFKSVDWDSLLMIFRPKALQAKGDEIYPVLWEMFRELKDGHIKIYTQGGFSVRTYYPPRESDRKTFSATVVRAYFNKPLRIVGNHKIEYGLINKQIGYMRISTFSSGDWIKEIDDVLQYFNQTRGLIIDVRNNSGGVSSTYEHVLSLFINEPIKETVYFKDGSQKSWWIYPEPDKSYVGKVVILLNGSSFSAAEIFTDLMQRLAKVTVIGDTSGGGGGASEVFKLPSGKRLSLPVKYFRRSDGQMIEWNGVIPDIIVEQDEADVLRRRDRQLEKAMEWLKDSS